MTMTFNSKKLKLSIQHKAIKTGKKPSEIRREIIKKFKITKQALSNWENGNCPKITQLFKMKEYFELPTIDTLFKN